MAAVVSSGTLGLLDSSLFRLGAQGQTGVASHGRAGERFFVNAATGNLYVQGQDEILVGRGPDAALLRTYNSQGLLNDDNGDNWRLGVYRKVYGLTGTANAAGSTVLRVDADGSEAVYTYDAARGKYVSTAGSGAYDTLSYNTGSQAWTWVDGESQLTETYDGVNGGRLTQTLDTSGNGLTYTYNVSGLITQVTDASGETTFLDYTGTNLTQLRTLVSGGATTIRTRYGYDTSNRLIQVATDLSPEDASVTDGKVYVTNYTYDGASRRVATMTQSDGTSLSLSYISVGSDYRVSQITDALGRVTAFAYDTTNRMTSVTDALGLVTRFSYDAAGQLISITSPAVAGAQQVVSYAYDASGNVTQVTDAQGNVVTYGHDANGNRTFERDAAGNTMERVFGAKNELRTETAYAGNTTTVSSGPGETWTLSGAAQIVGGVPPYLSLPGTSGSFASTPDSDALSITGDIDVRVKVSLDNWTPATWSNLVSKWTNGAEKEWQFTVPGAAGGVLQFRWSVDGTTDSIATSTAATGFANGSAHWLRATVDVDNGSAQRAITFYTSEDGIAWTQLGATITQGGATSIFNGNNQVRIGILSNGSDFLAGKVYGVEVRNGIDGAVVTKFDPAIPAPGDTSFTSSGIGQTWTLNGTAQLEGPNGARYLSLPGVNGSYARTPDSAVTSTTGDMDIRLKLSANDWTTGTASSQTLIGKFLGSGPNRSWLLRINGGGRPFWAWSPDGAATTNIVTADATPTLVDGQPAWLRVTFDVDNGAGGNTVRFYTSSDGSTWSQLGTDRVTAGVTSIFDTTMPIELGTYNGGAGELLTGGKFYYAEVRNGIDGSVVAKFDPNAGITVQPTSPLTTRYVYDANNRLRFTVSAEGRVTEYRYNAFGQRTAEIQYTASRYDLAGLAPGVTLTEAKLTAWLPADRSGSMRTDTAYDFRGQVASVTTYKAVNAAGNGIVDGSEGVTQYIYDQAGNLLKTVDPRGSATVDPNDYTTAYVYDGLGRLLSTTDALGRVTLTQHDDANRKTVLTLANALVTTSTYDAAGELISVLQSANSLALGETKYFYDVDGRLRRTEDPTGVKTHVLHDAAGRKIGTIDGDGSLTEYLYNANGDVTKIIRYATAVSAANLASLIDANGKPSNAGLAAIRPAAASADRITWNAYDGANRLVKSVDETGFVSQSFYDGADRVIRTVRYATAINTAPLSATPAPGDITPAANAADRVARNFYDAEGMLRGTLDGEGYLVEYKYDAAGQRVETVGYANATNASLRASGTLAQLTPAVNAADVHSYNFYNARGQLARAIDAEAYLTEYVYDAAGNKTQDVRYATKITGKVLSLSSGAAAYASTPDSAASSVTGDIDVRAQLTVADWSPTAERAIAGKDFFGNNRQWGFRLLSGSGVLNFYGSFDGTAINVNGSSTAAVGAVDGSAKWVRVTRSALTGQILFYTSDDGVTWAQLGGAINAAAGALFDGTAALIFGQPNGIAWDAKGHQFELRNGIDGPVVARFAPSLDAAVSSVTAFTSSTGEVWTLTGAANLQPTNSAPASSPQDQVTSRTYDALDRIASETGPDGTVTQYVYDEVGSLTKTVKAANTADVRTLTAQYDKQGRLTAELSANGAALLTGSQTQAQIDAIWAANSIKHAYDAAGRRKSSIDPLGNKTLFYYDADGRLAYTINALGELKRSGYDALGQLAQSVQYGTRLSSATLATLAGGLVDATLSSAIAALANASVDSTISYTYTGALQQTTDAMGNKVLYQYDAKGNRILERDAAGNTVSRLYNANNQLQNETVYVVPDPDGAGAAQPATPLTTRYAYDAQHNLRFMVSAEGRVTEHRYNAAGQRTASLEYAGNGYNLTGLSVTSTLSEATLSAWVASAAVDKTQAIRTDYTYDFRRQLSRTTTYTQVDASGNGVAATRADTDYVYDPAGNLVKTIDPRGVATLGDPNDFTTSAVYDRLGRVISSTDSLGRVTLTQYDAVNRKTIVALANGLVRTSTYDVAGELVSVLESAAAQPLGETKYFHDAAGRLRRTEDPTGVKTHILYDAAGRKIGEIDGDGSLTEYRYDANNNVTQTIRYANQVSPAALANLDWTAALQLPGTSGSYASTTDSARNQYGLRFDGATSYARADVAAPATFPTGSFEAWINMAALPTSGEAFIVSNYNGVAGQDGGWIWAVRPDGSINLRGNGIWTPTTPAGTVTPGVPAHFAMTVDSSGQIRFYKNGVQILSDTTTFQYRHQAYYFGRASHAAVGWANGTVDGARAYSRELSAAEVAEHYAGTFTNSTGLLGRWDFEQGSGTKAYDGSGNLNHATLISSPAWVSGIGNSKGGVTGDIDIRVRASLNDWTPGANQVLVAKSMGSPNNSYTFRVQTTGSLAFYGVTDGTATPVQSLSTVPTGIADGAAAWVRATLKVDNGAGGNDVKFYTSTDYDPATGTGTWIQLGSTVTTAGTTSLFDGTAPLGIGGRIGGTTEVLAGKVYYAEVRNGIDSAVVAKFDPSRDIGTSGASGFRSSTGESWSIAGAASRVSVGPTLADVRPSASASDAVARRIYDGANRLAKEIDAAGYVTQYFYDGAGRLTDTLRSATPVSDIALNLPGTSGSYATTPDSAAARISGDLDIRVKVAMDDWTPAGWSAFVSKDDTGAEREYAFFPDYQSSGHLYLGRRVGGTFLFARSSVATGFADGSVHLLRATHQISSGDVKFYKSDDGVSWTQLGDTVGIGAVGGPGSFTTRPVTVGNNSALSAPVAGKIYFAEIRNGIDGAVAAKFDPLDFVLGSPNANPTSSTSSTGEVWTLSGAARLAGPPDRALNLPGTAGSYASTPDKDYLNNTGMRFSSASSQVVTVADNADFQFGATQSFTVAGWWTFPAGTVNPYWSIGKGNAWNNVANEGGAPQTGGWGVAHWTEGGPVAPEFYMTDGVTARVAVAAASTQRGTPTHYAFVVDRAANTITAYTNGVAGAPVSIASVGDISAVGQALLLGGMVGNRYNGDLDGVRIYARALTGAEVGSLRSGNEPYQDPTNLVGRYDFEQTYGTKVLDGSGNANHGTAANAPAPIAGFGNSKGGLVGDIDIRVKAALNDWTPVGFQALASKDAWPNDIGFFFRVSPGGALELSWSPTGVGAQQISRASSATVPAADGEAIWVRAALDVDNGASQYELKFYTSADGATWTQLGATLTGAATSLYDSSRPISVGAVHSGSHLMSGKLYYAEVRNGIGGAVVAKFNPQDAVSNGPSSFTSSSGEVWTITGAASLDALNSTDRFTRNFYDAEGKLLGSLDGEGYLSENRYDAAGRLVETIGYKTATNAALRVTGTLAQLRPAAAAGDIRTFTRYNARGQIARVIDGEGYLTEFVYDSAGNKTQEIRYATKVSARALNLAGTAGSFAKTPDSPAVSITGDIEASGRYAPNDATPGYADGLLYKAGTLDVRLRSDGKLQAYFSLNGSAVVTAVSSAAAGFTDGAPLWWKVTRASATGTVKFFTSADGFSWTQLGTDQATTAGALFDSPAALEVGRSGGAAADFNGTTGKVTADSITLPSSGWTIEGWFVRDDDSLSQRSFFSNRGAGGQHYAGMTGKKPFLFINGGTPSSFVGNFTFTPGQLYHVVFTNDGVNTSSYVNGVLDKTAPQAAATASTGTVGIGWDPNIGTEFWDGKIDGVRTYNRPLSAAEIGQHYSGAYNDEAGLLSAWQLDDGSGSTVSDSTGNRNGTIAGGVSWATPLMVSASAAGRVYSAELRNGIGGAVVAKFDPAIDAAAASAASFSSATGEVWTLAGTASLNVVSSAQAQVRTYTYDALNRIATKSDPEGTLTQYAYDEVGNLVRSVKAAGTVDVRSPRAQYDKQGRLTAELSAKGAALITGSETQAQLDAIWAAHAVKHTYDAAGRRTSSTDADGRRTLFYYDADGRLTHTINALGEVRESRYNALGQVSDSLQYGTRLSSAALPTLSGGLVNSTLTSAVTTIAGPALDSKTSFVYDRAGLLQQRIDPLGNAVTQAFNAFRELASRTTALGGGPTLVESFAYDRRGLLKQLASDPSGINAVVNTAYDAFGRATQTTDARGNLTSRSFDRLGRVVTSTDAAGAVRATSYDAFNRVLAQTDALGKTTTYSYNDANRSFTVTTPEGIATTTVRNRHGETLSVTDGRGNATSYQYDLNGNLVQVNKPGEGSSTRVYDNANLMLETTDGLGTKTAFVYDAANRVLKRTVDAGSGRLNLVTTYAYDAKGQAVSVTDPVGTVTQTQFDLKGQVTQVAVDPAGLNLRTSYTYDARGETLTVTEGAGPMARITQYAYDKLGRRTSERLDPAGLNATTGYAYDKNGNVVRRTDAGGNVTRYAYDANDRLVYTVDALGGVTKNDRDANGRVVRVTVFSTPISLAGLSATPTVADIAARITSSASDRIKGYVYDADGREVYCVDALGGVTQKVYDANGNVVRTIAYASPVSPGIALTRAAIGAALAPGANDHIERTVYDAANRASFSIDAAGYVTQRVYDNNGNATKELRYANALQGSFSDNVAPQIVTSVPGSGAYVIADAAKDRVTRAVYDRANRVSFSIDAAGYVTQRFYDNAGNATKETRYATAVAAGFPENTAPPVVASANDRSSRFIYDAAARLRYGLDALGFVSERRFDALGHETSRIRYADAVSVGDGATVAGMAALLPATVPASAVREDARYDTAGRLAETVDGEGFVTRTLYDAAGRKAQVFRAYGTSAATSTLYINDALGRVVEEIRAYGTANASSTRYVLDAFGNRLRIIESRGIELAETDSAWALATRNGKAAAALTLAEKDALRAAYTTTQQFDALGRKTRTTDAPGGATVTAGGVTVIAYDAFGNAVKLTDPRGNSGYFYFDARNEAVLSVDPEGYAVRTFYDAFGNVEKTVRHANKVTGTVSTGAAPTLIADIARDQVTLTEYDRRGSKIKVTDAEGNFEQYTYDAFGNKATYRNPLGGVYSYTYDRAGHVLSETLPVGGIVNRFEYDARGNRTRMTEAAGLPEQRVTVYEFDRLDRLRRQIGQAVSVYDAASGVSSTMTPIEQQSFDSRGNLIEKIAATGARTLYYYDALDRKIAELGALGALVTYTYNSGANALTQCTYGDPVAMPAVAGGVPPAPIPSANYREVLLTYDAMGRRIESRVANVFYGKYDTGSGTYIFQYGSLRTTTEYNANGLAVLATDPNGGATYTFYNKAGYKILEADAQGYGVAWQRDASGNATRETRYATRYAGAPFSVSSDGEQLRATWATSSDDRIVDYVYDRNSRLTQETRLNVAFGSVDSAGTLTTGFASAATTYLYDAAGNIRRKTDATGQTDFAYDALSRKLRYELPVMTDYAGAAVRNTTDYEYDGLNNLVREIRRGTNNATEADDQITRYTYGAGGRLAATTDAEQKATQYFYDAAGRTTRELYDRADADGLVRTEAIDRRYDLLGREFHRVSLWRIGAGAWTAGDVRETGYNAYGEVTGKRLNGGGPGGAWQEWTEYDKVGRAFRTNADQGVIRAYLYDLNGNAIVRMESQALDLRTLTAEQMLASNAVFQTVTIYDQRNQVADIIQAKMTGERPLATLQAAAVPLASGNFSNSPLFILGSQQVPAEQGAAIGARGVGSAGVTGSLYIGDSIDWGYNNGKPDGLYFSFPAEGLRRLFGDFDIYIGIDVTRDYTWVTDTPAVGEAGEEGYVAPTHTETYGYVSNHFDLGAYNNPTSGGFNWNASDLYYQVYFHYSANIYIVPHSTGQYIYAGNISQTTTSHDGHTLGGVGTTIYGSNMLSLSGDVTDAAVANLFYRPWGSNAAFQPIGISRVQADRYFADLAGLGGDYEMVLMATAADGTLTRRTDYYVHVTGDTASASVQILPESSQAAFAKSGFVAATSGTYVFSPGTLNMYGLRTSASARPSFIKVRYRPLGSGGAFTAGTRVDPVSTGVFYWSHGLQGAYETVVEMYNAGGGLLDALKGTINFGPSAANLTVDLTYIKYLSTSLTFQGLELTGTKLDITYTATSGGGPSGSFLQRPIASPGSYVWDTDGGGLTPDKTQVYTYNITFTVYDNDGFIVNKGTGSISVGAIPSGSSAALSGSSRPRVLTLTPPQPTAARLQFRYRLKNDLSASFTAIVLNKLASGKFKWDASSLDGTKDYEYYYDLLDASGAVLARNNGYFRPDNTTVNDADNKEVRLVLIGLHNLDETIHRKQTHDAFREVDREIDGRLNETSFTYNTLGKMTSKTEAAVNVTLANGFVVPGAKPVTRWYNDLAGQVVGVDDANGNRNTQTYNYGTGQASVAKEWHADGGTKINSYDAYGILRAMTEAVTATSARRTDYTYDKINRLVRVDRPVRADGSRAFDSYEYDLLGNRIAHRDALGRLDKTYYDSEGRVAKTVSAEGRTTAYSFTPVNNIRTVGERVEGGTRRVVTDPNGRTLIDDLDYFGHTMTHTDLEGRVFTYRYNQAGLIASQTGTSGQNIEYLHYGNGFVRRMRDLGTDSLAIYEYDANGNRTYEGYTSDNGNIAFQQSNVAYDALNRVIRIADNRYTIDYEYDAVGNRRRVRAEYVDGIGGTKGLQDYWYQYDSMNRFTVTMGKLSSGVQRGISATDTSVSIIPGSGGGDGVRISYDYLSERTSAFYAADGRTESYSYTGDGFLTDTSIDGVLRTRRANDLGGRVLEYFEWEATGPTGPVRTHLARNWDRDNIVRSEFDFITSKTSAYTLMNDGTLSSVFTSGGTGPATTTTYTYEYWDSAKQKDIKIQASWAPGFSHFTYDVNGHVKGADDPVNGDSGKARSFVYWTDGDGQVLRRDEYLNGTFNPVTGKVDGARSDRSHNYYYLNGHRIGNVGNDGIDRIDYAQELAIDKNAGRRPEDRYRLFRPTSSADFDENYQPINSQYPGSAPSSYTVHGGETLQNIAQSVWGDSAMWYLIADANGLSGSEQLKAGQVLSIPNKVTNVHNTSSTYKPYDAGKAIGETNPTLPDPPPPPSKKCSGVMMIVIIVIAIVATIFTAGAAAVVMAGGMTALAGAGVAGIAAAGMGAMAGVAAGAAIGAGMATLSAGALMAAAAIGAAVGSIASQSFAVATGYQEKFSWSAVATSAIAAGITSGVGAAFQATGIAGQATAGWSNGARAAASAATSNTLTQGVNVLLGTQDKFDWKGVAVAAVSSGVGAEVSGGMTKEPSGMFERTMNHFATGAVSGAAGAVVRGDGNFNYSGLIANAVTGSLLEDLTYDPITAQDVDTGRAMLSLAQQQAQPVREPAGQQGGTQEYMDDSGQVVRIAPQRSNQQFNNDFDQMLPGLEEAWQRGSAQRGGVQVAHNEYDVGNGKTLVTYDPDEESAPEIPGKRMTSEGWVTSRPTPQDRWTSQRIYADNNTQAEQGVQNPDGSTTWPSGATSYPISPDGPIARELPADGPVGPADKPSRALAFMNGFASTVATGLFGGPNEMMTPEELRSWDAANPNRSFFGGHPQVSYQVDFGNGTLTREIVTGPSAGEQLKDIFSLGLRPIGNGLGNFFGGVTVSGDNDYSDATRDQAAYDAGSNALAVPGAALSVVGIRGATYPKTRILSLGEGEAVYVIENSTGLTLRAEGTITGPHVGRGKGALPEPVGGRAPGDHRGHLIPEGGVENPALVNIRPNLVSEAPASNLGLKKSMDFRASRIAAENPDSVVRFVSQPIRVTGESRPHAVTHSITVDGKVVESVTVLNK